MAKSIANEISDALQSYAVAADGNPVSNERASATLHAYIELKRMIHAGDLKPGRTYLQQALAELLKVSRTPVREAVIRLSEDGLVEVRPRYGVYIRTVSLSELKDIYEVLAALESHAVMSIASRKLQPASHERLAGFLEAMEAATVANEVAAWFQSDHDFHVALALECGNAELGTLVASLRDRMSRCAAIVIGMRVIPTQSNAEHAAVLAAMSRSEARLAHELLLAHHERTTGEMLDLLKRRDVLEL